MATEESIDPEDAACVALQDCLQQLARWPSARGLLATAERLLADVSSRPNSTIPMSELRRIEIDLALAQMEPTREGSESLASAVVLGRSGLFEIAR